MDSNDCDSNLLEGDVRLPPRKRLLAGLKKQNCSESQSTSQCSQENSASRSLSPSIVHSPLSEFDIRLDKLLKSYKNGFNMSPEEIAVAADLAATAAAKAAETARADAEEKAAVAAKAVAAAKSALDMVALVSEETSSSRHQRKNKLKKHVPVQQLYKKYQPVETCGTDEELARRLHQAMNSSPRISKSSPGSDSKNLKHKKLRTSPTAEKNDIPNGTSWRDENGKVSSACNGDGIDEGGHYKESNEDAYNGKVDEDVLKSSKVDEVGVDSGETESSHLKGKSSEGPDDMCNSGRKRGRIKQKKLPLSFCSSKDQANPKDDLHPMNSLLTRARTDKSTACHVSLPSDKVTPMEVAPTWKCQDFNVSQCIKQNKFVQS